MSLSELSPPSEAAMKCTCGGPAPVVVICIDCKNRSETKAYANGFDAGMYTVLEQIKRVVNELSQKD